MKPLRVVARLSGAVALPYSPLALDALLAWAVCCRDQVPQCTCPEDIVPIDIPVEKEPGGRFHLCSVGHCELDQAELRYINKRAPVDQYVHHGDAKIKSVQISAGPNKSYRIPLGTMHLKNDEIIWWCIGDADGIRSLLSLVHYVGKKRSTGLGKVREWHVEELATPECWHGFPVMRDGYPLRTLPAEWPGLVDGPRRMANVTYPYWMHSEEQLCAVPVAAGL